MESNWDLKTTGHFTEVILSHNQFKRRSEFNPRSAVSD